MGSESWVWDPIRNDHREYYKSLVSRPKFGFPVLPLMGSIWKTYQKNKRNQKNKKLIPPMSESSRLMNSHLRELAYVT